MNYQGIHNPAHPGAVLKEFWLDGLNLSITDAAKKLGLSRKTLSHIVNQKAPITPETAMRIEIAFNSRAGLWIDMQAGYDAWQIEQRRADLEKVVTVVSWQQA